MEKYRFIKYILAELFVVLTVLTFLFGCEMEKSIESNIPAGEGDPIIEFTYVPPYNSSENLKGQIWHVKPADFKVIVYIYVGGWWTKPYFNNPLTTIQNDGSWECDITTGGIDERATKIVAFLVTNEYNAILQSGNSKLPNSVFQNSLSYVEAVRVKSSNVKIISFSGYEWIVKSSHYQVGPGPNYFSDSIENVWVESGQLHLKITVNDGKWYCAEVISKQNFGYGKYSFKLASRADQFNENVVLGLFTWDDSFDYNHREIDIEFSKWGQTENDNSQYVVQPWNNPSNIYKFNTQLERDSSTHSFEWRSSSISFQSIYGNCITPLDSNCLIDSWIYTDNNIPKSGNENARINLWLLDSKPPSDNDEVEVVINKFEFTK